MTEQNQSQNNYEPEVTISYALAQDDPSYQKNLESAMQVLLHHFLQGNLAIVDCVSSDPEQETENATPIPVIAATIEYNGKPAIVPLGRLFTEDDHASQKLVPVLTDPRKVN